MGEEKTIPQQIEELRALLVEGFAALNKRVDTLTQSAPPETPQAPTRTDGLFRFVRPAVRDVTQWPIGVDMTTPDAEEAFQRSLHGVNWRGGHLSPQSYDEAWAEIDALKRRLEGVTNPRGGEILLIAGVEGGREVEIRLPGRFTLDGAVRGALKTAPGVVFVEDI